MLITDKISTCEESLTVKQLDCVHRGKKFGSYIHFLPMVASGEISENFTLVKNTRNMVYSAATNQAPPGVQLQFEGGV